MNRLKVTVLQPLFLALCTVAALRAGTIDYRFATGSNLQVSSFDFGGVTVTGGAGLVFVNVSNGLSIIGGNNSAVDPGEFLTFTFDGDPAYGIFVHSNSSLSSPSTLQAFGPGSLGSQPVTIDETAPFDVSGIFGDQAITTFTLTDVSGGFRLDTLSFTTTPEPTSQWLFLAGLGAIVVLRPRHLSHATRRYRTQLELTRQEYRGSQDPSRL